MFKEASITFLGCVKWINSNHPPSSSFSLEGEQLDEFGLRRSFMFTISQRGGLKLHFKPFGDSSKTKLELYYQVFL